MPENIGRNATVEDYTKSYVSYSACDICAAFNGIVIGSLQALTYNISREKSPIYTFGCANPRGFARGKRGIAGTLVFTVFDRDALIEGYNKKYMNDNRANILKYKANNSSKYVSVNKWDEMMTSYIHGETTGKTEFGDVQDLVEKKYPQFADEILPFDITLTFANEYGSMSTMSIYGVELLNEGGGFSMDTVLNEKAYTFVARSIEPMKPVEENGAVFSATF